MKWKDITVQQFQEIYKLSVDSRLSEHDKIVRLVCIVFDKSEQEVNNFTVKQFAKLADKCSFLLDVTQIPGKPKRLIRSGLKFFRLSYDPKNLSLGQYTDLMALVQKPIENMHLILATVIRKKPLFSLKKYDPVKDLHRIADRIQSARITDVYHSSVFFCKLLNNSIEATQDYSDQMKKKSQESKIPQR